MDLKHIKAKLNCPSGKQEQIECKSNPDKTLCLEFSTTETGKHLIYITKNDNPVNGSPLIVDVDSSGNMTVGGSEVDSASNDGDLSPITLECEIPGLKLPDDIEYLKGSVEHPNGKKRAIELTAGSDNKTIIITFTPSKVGKYVIHITFTGKLVNKNPFKMTTSITQTEIDQCRSKTRQVKQGGFKCSVNFKATDFNLPTDLKYIKAKLSFPSGDQDQIECKSNPDNTLCLEFSTIETGKHLVYITKNDNPVNGSPLIVEVDSSGNMTVGGSEGDSAPTEDDLSPMTLECEIPGLKLPDDIKYLRGSIEFPSGKKEAIELISGSNDKTIVITFLPTEVGKYLIHITFTGRLVHKSPFKMTSMVTQSEIEQCRLKAKHGKQGGFKYSINFQATDFVLPNDLKHIKAKLNFPSGEYPMTLECEIPGLKLPEDIE